MSAATTVPPDAHDARDAGYEVYDFRRPATLAREQARLLEPAIESFGRLWATQFSAQVRVPVTLQLDQLQLISYAELTSASATSRIVAVCTAEGLRAKPTLSVPYETGLLIVSRLLGGSGSFLPAERPITDIESRILQEAVAGLVRDLEYALGELLTTTLAVDGILYGTQPVQAAVPTDVMVVLGLTLQIADHVADLMIAMPADSLRLTLGARTDNGAADATAALRRHLGDVPLELSLRVSDVAIEPERVMRLTPGDLIVLPHEQTRPLLVTVDGHLFATAATGRSGTRLACRIVTTLEEKAS